MNAHRKTGFFSVGIILLVAGVGLLLSYSGANDFLTRPSYLLPIFIILLGLELLITRIFMKDHDTLGISGICVALALALLLAWGVERFSTPKNWIHIIRSHTISGIGRNFRGDLAGEYVFGPYAGETEVTLDLSGEVILVRSADEQMRIRADYEIAPDQEDARLPDPSGFLTEGGPLGKVVISSTLTHPADLLSIFTNRNLTSRNDGFDLISARYTIEVPDGITVVLSDNRVMKVEGENLACSIKGNPLVADIDLEDISGDISLSAQGAGDFKLTNINGSLDLSLALGEIQFRGVSGSAVAHVDAGSIAARDVAGALKATLSTGQITIKDCRGDITAENHLGAIALSGADYANARVRAEARLGSIQSGVNFLVPVREATSSRLNYEPAHATVKIGLQCTNGSISID